MANVAANLDGSLLTADDNEQFMPHTIKVGRRCGLRHLEPLAVGIEGEDDDRYEGPCSFVSVGRAQ